MKIGILGGGQLGRMLTLAGYNLGFEFRLLDPLPNPCASQIAQTICADYTDPEALEKFMRGLDVVTYEFENVPAETVDWLGERIEIHPGAKPLRFSQDRLPEKELFSALQIPTPEFFAVASFQELEEARKRINPDSILKTRRLGYDGKGQWQVAADTNSLTLWDEATAGESSETSFLLERKIEFSRELSIIGVRSKNGGTAFYPLIENVHMNGLLMSSKAPAKNVQGLQKTAESYAAKLMAHLNYVGVLALELFDVNGNLIANEFAPRVHNSGHWTIEGAATSQFENHLRAICGLPLGATSVLGNVAMKNIIGIIPALNEMLANQDAHVHLYGKEPREGRKLGHITTVERFG